MSISIFLKNVLDKYFWVMTENSNSEHSSPFCVACTFKSYIYSIMCSKLI